MFDKTADRGIPYLPAGFSDPNTVSEALRAGKAVLQEEGRWCQGSELDVHRDDDGNLPKQPYCGSWQACAVGALGVVTQGAYLSGNGRQDWFVYTPPADSKWRQMYLDGVNILDQATLQVTRPAEANIYGTDEEYDLYNSDLEEYYANYGFEEVVDKNDHDKTTLSEMLTIFDAAIALAEQKEQNPDAE